MNVYLIGSVIIAIIEVNRVLQKKHRSANNYIQSEPYGEKRLKEVTFQLGPGRQVVIFLEEKTAQSEKNSGKRECHVDRVEQKRKGTCYT